MATKYIFVTGGVVSSLGKGLAASSIGRLLEARGFRVTLQKFDPYLNVDPGTMSPFQHGEVFVTDDGAETDLDLGHYERYVSTISTKDHNFTTGKIYESVIKKERRGDYLGGTVQVIPHITDEIKAAIRSISAGMDIQICEIGGTVGDIESLPFLEAIRQFRLDVGKTNCLFIHLTLVPYIAAANELKTKPTQHSVRELRAIGIQPDILLCRCDRTLPQDMKRKIALFCNVPEEAVITAQDVPSIYQVPLMLGRESLDAIILKELDLPYKDKNMDAWEAMVRTHLNPSGGEVHIGMVGKYVRYEDSYKSLSEALTHGGIANDVRVHLDWIEGEDIENGSLEAHLSKVDAILVPGGFGIRGTAGMIEAIRFARENKIPFFGICLGLQTAVLEFARNVADLKDADSSEFNEESTEPIIYKLRDLLGVDDLGGTMRLGSYPCKLTAGSFAAQAYGETEIHERHRHRYEFNKHYYEILADAGLQFTGLSPDRKFVEIIELKDHPWFLACQFHPEFKSRPLAPHPLFKRFIRAAVEQRDSTANKAESAVATRAEED